MLTRLNLPRSVVVACAFLALSLIGMLLTQIFLARKVEEQREQNSSIQRSIASSTGAERTSVENRVYVQENINQYEEILRSDLLVPHTRRSVLRLIEQYALAVGLTQLNYEFEAAEVDRSSSLMRQVEDSEYRVNVEKITLSIAALTDRAIFLFIQEIVEDIPGTAVLQSVELSRPTILTTNDFNSIASESNPRVVRGTVIFEWRTAQSIRADEGA